MSVLCYSVRLESLVRISDKAFLATCYDGRSAVIPSSQVYGEDHDVSKSNAWWISAWILSRTALQYSVKKQAWFSEDGRLLPTYSVEHHTPERHAVKESNIIKELKRHV